MQFKQQVVNQVLWTATDEMAYCNLPKHMMQHQMDVQEFNGVLLEVCRWLVTDMKARQQPLNPLAPRFEQQQNNNASANNKDETKQQENQQSQNSGIERNEWKTVEKRYKPKKQQSHS